MPEEAPALCPCGAAAPALPPPGGAPVPCRSCGTPLVQPGSESPDAVLRALGSALLVSVACAAGWAVLAKETASGAPWVIAVAGAAVGGTARLAADRRGFRVQTAAVAAFLVFLVLGEGLLYRTALRPRLEAMQAAEGAEDPASLADRELGATDLLQYLQIEVGLAWLVAAGAGLWLAARIPRLPPAVAAFPSRAPAAPAGAVVNESSKST